MDLHPVLALAAGLLVVWALLLVVLWVLRPRGVTLGELLRIVPDILRLVRALIADRATPLGVRLALVGLLVWLISPVDLVPEFIPVLGPFDDVVIAVVVLRYAHRRLGESEFRRRWPGTPEGYGLLRSLL